MQIDETMDDYNTRIDGKKGCDGHGLINKDGTDFDVGFRKENKKFIEKEERFFELQNYPDSFYHISWLDALPHEY